MYTPQKHPKEALTLIVIISMIGILAGSFLNEFFMVFSLVFWMQYTAALSYIQFKKKSKHFKKSITHKLLNPQLRFFIFEFLAILGLLALVQRHWTSVGVIVLFVWTLFSINFYMYYDQFKKYEN